MEEKISYIEIFLYITSKYEKFTQENPITSDVLGKKKLKLIDIKKIEDRIFVLDMV